MIIPDANLLIYAHDEASPGHAKARSWWEAVLSGRDPVGIAWVVVLAVTRLLTHPNVCENPLSPAQVRRIVEHWQRQRVPDARIRRIASENYARVLKQAMIGKVI